MQDCNLIKGISNGLCRRAFASMRAVHLYLRARAVINFLMRAASTLESANGEQRALLQFTPAGIFIKTLFLRQVIWLTLSKQENRCMQS